MLTISKTLGYMPLIGNQSNRVKNQPNLRTLDKDTVSFRGLLGNTKAAPKFVSEAVHEAVSKFIKDNPHTKASYFMQQIKLICEQGTDTILEMDAQIFAREVEKAHIERVSGILKQVKESTQQPLLKKWMDRFDKTLGTGPLK